jgi:hypothetical protein
MSTLQDRLASAIHLRKSNNLEEARQLLLELHSEFPEDPQVNYGSKLLGAWLHDLLGLEREAFPFCAKAIQTGLSAEDLKSALHRRISKIQRRRYPSLPARHPLLF